jgi:predicted hydrocarbon binding protein
MVGQISPEDRKDLEPMATETTERLLPLELPLMYVAPQRSLTYLYAEVDDISALDRLQRALPGGSGALRASYWYRLPDSPNLLAVLTVDLTEAAEDATETLRQLTAVPGVHDVRRAGSGLGLAASEHHRLQVAGTPIVVMAREVLGGVFKSFAGKVETESIYQTGVEMGRLAGSAVPPLLERLGRPLTLDLLRERLLDFQVFGWAEQVRRVAVQESLHGEIELEKTFEAAPWQGKATESTCHFLRGFTVGVFSFAYHRDFASAEDQCQGKGDAICRISFQPSS